MTDNIVSFESFGRRELQITCDIINQYLRQTDIEYFHCENGIEIGFSPNTGQVYLVGVDTEGLCHYAALNIHDELEVMSECPQCGYNAVLSDLEAEGSECCKEHAVSIQWENR